MTLIRKLPLGFALAACVAISSCSNEDLQAPQPEKVKNSFNSERGVLLQSVPTLSKTDGAPGIFITRPDWKILQTVGPAEGGTSTKNYLWGDPSLPWTKPLTNAPGSNNNDPNNFVTFSAQHKVLNADYTDSRVQAKIKNLVKGKKYALTISMANSVLIKNGEPTNYSPGVRVQLPGTVNPDLGSDVTVFDLRGTQAEWVTKTITFTAYDTETFVYIYNYLDLDPQFKATHDKYMAYMHVFAGGNAIVEVP